MAEGSVQEYERSILSDGAHGLLVFAFWVLQINLTNKLLGASRTSPRQEAEAYDAPGGPRRNGGEHPARRKLVLRLKAETADCGGLV